METENAEQLLKQLNNANKPEERVCAENLPSEAAPLTDFQVSYLF